MPLALQLGFQRPVNQSSYPISATAVTERILVQGKERRARRCRCIVGDERRRSAPKDARRFAITAIADIEYELYALNPKARHPRSLAI